jgi:hypothetical protein
VQSDATLAAVEPAGTSPVQAQRLSALDDLVAGFLLSKRSPRTRAAYAADLASWRTGCDAVGVELLAAGTHHADAYLRLLADSGDPRTGRPLTAANIAGGTASTDTPPATAPSPAPHSPTPSAPPSRNR